MNTSLPSIVPNLDWYTDVSQKRAVPMRCPFATVEACPRYYQSLSLLGLAGSTKITDKEDQRLLKFWKASDLWPRTDELTTGIFGKPDNPSIFSNFCPELMFERFGHFATSLTRYVDEEESGFAHQRLAADRVPANHPNWNWSSYVSQHFTDCQIYSVLHHRAGISSRSNTEPWWRKHLAEIVVAVVVALTTAYITNVLT